MSLNEKIEQLVQEGWAIFDNTKTFFGAALLVPAKVPVQAFFDNQAKVIFIVPDVRN